MDTILDPEPLLDEPAYLMPVALGDDDTDDSTDGDEKSTRHRLLVLEDCDELIRAPIIL